MPVVLLFLGAGILRRISLREYVLTLTMLQSWLPPLSLAINPPVWSLSTEVLFYVMVPAIWCLDG